MVRVIGLIISTQLSSYIHVHNYIIMLLSYSPNQLQFHDYTQCTCLLAHYFPHAVILVLVNCYSVKLTARVSVVFSGLKILAIAFIVVVGIVTAIVNRCYPDELRQPFQPLEGHEPTASSVALALYSVMWAYDGWLVHVCTYTGGILVQFGCYQDTLAE